MHGACGVETRARAHGGDCRTAVVLVGEYELRKGGVDDDDDDDDVGGRGAKRVGGTSVFGVRFARTHDDDDGDGDDRDDDGGGARSVIFERLGRVECSSAVFEAKWSPRGETDDRAVVADAAGGLSLIRVVDDDSAPTVRVEHVLRVGDVGGDGLGMVTCVDWSASGAFAASASDGSFRLLCEREGGIDVVETFEGAHDLEMWAIAFDRTRRDVVYTGADDCALKVWDARDATRASATNRKTHGAGVTCVVPSPHDDHIIATGSYDDYVRLWDCRRIATPLSECNVGGGAWRARWHRSRRALACAAMGGGAVLLDAANDALTAVYTYDDHESIVYGADWVSAPNDTKNNNNSSGNEEERGEDENNHDDDVLVTCSFYDNDVRCWKPPRRTTTTTTT